MSQAEAWRRELRYLPRQRIWLFTINSRWARDAAFGGNVARSSRSHRVRLRIAMSRSKVTTSGFCASRKIRKGEELTYDYNTDGVAGIPVPLPSALPPR